MLAESARRGRRDRPALPPRGRAVRRARQRHVAVGRLAAGRGRRSSSRSTGSTACCALDPDTRTAVVEPGVINLDVSRAARAARAGLRARPVQPVGLHDRRQPRVQLRRRALPQARDDQQPRARASRRCCPTARWSTWAATAASPSGPDWTGMFCRLGGPVRRSRSRSRCGSSRSPRRRAPRSPSTTRLEAAGDAVARDRARGAAAGRDGDHGRARDRGRRGVGASPATPRAPRC